MMSDIDDLLSEFDAPVSTSASRYIPNPADFASGNAAAVESGLSGLKSAGSDFLSQGLTPSIAGRAAMAGLEYLSAPFAGLGKYVGTPVGNIVGDVTGSPTAGKLAGDTAGLVPLMAAPFPGVKSLGTLGEGAAAMIGEAPAARSAVEGIATKLGARGAVANAESGSSIDDMLNEFETGAVRRTSHSPKAPVDWYERQFRGGDTPEIPPMGAPDPTDVRLMHAEGKGVGKQKWAKGEDGKPVVMQGYEDPGGGRPTLRTSHVPKQPAEPEAPTDWYGGQFQRELNPDQYRELGPSPTQMPIQNDALIKDIRLQDLKGNADIDPNLLAELQLKFNMGGPIPPKSTPMLGSSPMEPPPTPPSGSSPRAPIPDKPLTPANVDKDVTRYGDLEVGGNYDIVHAVGGNEMRATGGKVKELITVDEPAVSNGKQIMRPTAYAVLEDGRRVPAKMLQPSSGQPKIAAMGDASVTKPTAKQAVPEASTQETADPAFAKVQAAMAKKKQPQLSNEEISGEYAAKAAKSKLTQDTVKTIKQLIDGPFKGKITDHAIREKMPTATRAQIDKAVKELQATTHPRLNRATGDDGVPFIAMKKATAKDATQDSGTAKAEHFGKGLAGIVENRKAAYLHDLAPAEMSRRAKANISMKTAVEKINELILTGRAKVYPEGEPGKKISQISAKHFDRADHDHDFTIEFTEPGSVLAKSFAKKKAIKKEE